MSMIGNYRRVTPKELAALQQRPETISTFLYPANIEAVPIDRSLDIDKAWHAIHFLLNGEPWEGDLPLHNAVLGGTPLGEEDVGYGPARFLTPTEVAEVARALRGITPDELRARFDPQRLAAANIYPSIWDDPDDALDYMLINYQSLARFFQQAAQAGDAMLLYIN